jgi:hypothetical protein
MSHCPSHDWDRYCDQNDPPEDCPVCHEPNSDEDGNPVCAEAVDFCSTACRDQYAAEQRAADEAEAKYQAELDAMEPEIAAAIADCREVEQGMAEEYDYAADDRAFDAARERR